MEKKSVILVVEDEAIIRMGAVMTLEEAGFAVIEASNADEAILIPGLRNDISAVFTDINMPGSLDGMKLAHAIRGSWPLIHVIVTSGMMSPSEKDLPANGRFIRKPYLADHLVTTIQELLSAKAA